MNSVRKGPAIIVESEPLCDLLPLAFESTDTGLQAYTLPATPQQTTKNVNIFTTCQKDFHSAPTLKIFVRLDSIGARVIFTPCLLNKKCPNRFHHSDPDI